MDMPQCCYLAKGAKRPSHTTNTTKFDRIPFDPCNSIKKFDLCPFDQKNSTYLQPPMPEDSAEIYKPGFLGSRKEDNQCTTQQLWFDCRWMVATKWIFVGVFACFDVDGVNEKPLLAFSVLPDETDLGADSTAGFIETTLEYYKKTRTDVNFIVSDNEHTMRAVAKK